MPRNDIAAVSGESNPRHPAAAPAIAAIAGEMEGVCQLLTSPSPATLERCAEIMESATSRLSGLRPELETHRGEAAALPAARQLQSAVRRATLLLESAFQYHEQWRLRVSASLAGYSPDGSPAAIPHRVRVCVEG